VTATGYNVIDLEAAKKHGVVISNVPTYGTSPLPSSPPLMLELCNQVGLHDTDVHAGGWGKKPDFATG
jgi:glycerate dehydrogenase